MQKTLENLPLQKRTKKLKKMDLKAIEVWERLKDPDYYSATRINEKAFQIKTSFQLEHPKVYVSTMNDGGRSKGFVMFSKTCQIGYA